ncbi:hypothetical protein BT63DRAFT_420458 [Microthyrium microscopicum]|uniref:DnaJ homologue subfamily C member 28 conserved domain-containing protein n=1 Tax=Microthyrium microscopicum TaxID=703497 RepID=A0A6A6UUU2_9PEZI|nr:hypothetical protein BT63DRAFT_420458 [Microthyrium microscopicum]
MPIARVTVRLVNPGPGRFSLAAQCRRRLSNNAPARDNSPKTFEIPQQVRNTSAQPSQSAQVIPETVKVSQQAEDASSEPSQGAMSARLEQLTEEALESGTTNLDDASFSAELRDRLAARIALANNLQTSHPQAFAEANLRSSAGHGTRDLASAQPWTGNEALADTALRMLNDAHKPLKSSHSSAPEPRIAPQGLVGVRRKPSAGARIASAKERSSQYAQAREAGLSQKERQQLSDEMKARFEPSARELPATLGGLAALANRRIDEAIARGKFKNLPRGKELERDYNASSPFIDTTEYLMNKMIKKQDIVPPWIEKQQELATAVRVFRLRMRNDWKRHAARMIAAVGGSLDEKVQRAHEYALAEQDNLLQPADKEPLQPETLEPISQNAHLSQISLSGQLEPSHSASKSRSSISEDSGAVEQEPTRRPSMRRRLPFRDTAWEATEHSFHKHSIANLNSITRSYNLIAPQLAQKPYFSLERELKACYAEVAPFLPAEIRQRALVVASPYPTTIGVGPPGGLLSNFDKTPAKVHDEDIARKGYGWRQFWRDMTGRV